MPDVHLMYYHYKEYPLSRRVLYTCTLLTFGMAYLFAMTNLYITNAGRDGEPGMSTQDIAIAYSGNKEATKLEAALTGPMSRMLPTGETDAIVVWVRKGADKQEYDAQIAPLIEKRCLACHDGTNPHIAALSDYEGVLSVAEHDTGMNIGTLVRVSHIHLFGVTFIFFIMGFIFSHAYVRPKWFKSLIIILPFVAISLDIFSWYLTKFAPSFAWVVFVFGGLMGVSFALQWVISMYQIWFSKYQAPRDHLMHTGYYAPAGGPAATGSSEASTLEAAPGQEMKKEKDEP